MTTIIRLSFSYILAFIFIWAGVAKLIHPEVFMQSVQGYGNFGASAHILFLVAWMPWLEITVGLAFLFQSSRRAAASLTILLLLSVSTLFDIVIPAKFSS